MKRNYLIYLAFAFAITLASCYREPLGKIRKVNGVNWSGTYAVPLVDARLNMEDVTEFISDLAGTGVYPDKLIYFDYSTQRISRSAAEVYRLQERSSALERHTLSTAEEVQLQAGSVSKTIYSQVLLGPSGNSSLNKVKLSGGDLSIALNNEIPHDAQIKIALPDANPPKSITVNVPWTGNAWSRQATLDLSGSEYALWSNTSDNNILKIEVTVTYTRTGSNPVTGFNGLTFQAGLISPRFEWLEGNLDVWNLFAAAPDSFKLGIFTNDITKGKLVFNDARFKFRWSHNLNTTLPVSLSNLRFTMQDGNTEIVSGISSGLTAKPSNDPNTFVSDSIYLNSINSNVAQLVSEAPTRLSWTASVEKPAGSMRIYANASMELFAALELPFSGSVQRFALRDTADFDLGIGQDELQYLDWINLRLYVENGIPLSAGVQMFFLDGSGQTIDSLLQPYRFVLPAPVIDMNGNVIKPHKESYDVKFEKSRIMNISRAVKSITRVEFPSAGFAGVPVPVKISSDNKVAVKLGIQSKVTVKERF